MRLARRLLAPSQAAEPSRALAGSVAGLVVITPCAGYIPVWAAFVVGLLAGLTCHWSVVFVEKMQWDDAVDVWAVHGMGGLLGSGRSLRRCSPQATRSA